MKSAAAAQMMTTDNILSSKSQANFSRKARTTKAMHAGNQAEIPDGFIVGALLFSLLAPSQSEIVSEMLPSDE